VGVLANARFAPEADLPQTWLLTCGLWFQDHVDAAALLECGSLVQPPALQIQEWPFQNRQLSQELRDSLHSFECLERDQQAKAEIGSAGQMASFVRQSRSELSIWRMIFHSA
jgi:hypothetical protein